MDDRGIRTTGNTIKALTGAGLLLAAAAACSTVSAQPAGGAPTTPAPANAQKPTEITADELLLALERADRDIKTISAEVMWINVAPEVEGNDRQIRRGELFFADRRQPAQDPGAAPKEGDKPDKQADPKVQPAANEGRLFQVRFDSLEADGKRWPDERTYILRGEWFVEKLANEKQMFKRAVIAPGEKIDPLRIGEGPFPLPIGQKRDDILARFTVELVPSFESLPVDKLSESSKQRYQGTYQLKLIPKAGTQQAKDYREVRFWYTKANLVPIHVKTIGTTGGVDEVVLANVQINKDLPETVFDIRPPDGWDVHIEPYRRPADENK